MIDAAPTHSAFSGILGGFLFAGLIVLMTERKTRHHGDSSPAEGVTADRHESLRVRTLMLFLPALLSLLVASFLFSEVAGEQSCARGYMAGILAGGLLGMGGLGVFSGIAWMLEIYGEAQQDLRHASVIVTYTAYVIVASLLAVSGVDVIQNVFDNKVPAYASVPVIAYGPLLLVALVVVRRWFQPEEDAHAKALLYAAYAPMIYVAVTVVTYAWLTSYSPEQWRSLDDWKTYLALSISLLLPAITMIVYLRALPPFSFPREKAGSRAHAARRLSTAAATMPDARSSNSHRERKHAGTLSQPTTHDQAKGS